MGNQELAAENIVPRRQNREDGDSMSLFGHLLFSASYYALFRGFFPSVSRMIFRGVSA